MKATIMHNHRHHQKQQQQQRNCVRSFLNYDNEGNNFSRRRLVALAGAALLFAPSRVAQAMDVQQLQQQEAQHLEVGRST